jgi:hypothetical protein
VYETRYFFHIVYNARPVFPSDISISCTVFAIPGAVARRIIAYTLFVLAVVTVTWFHAYGAEPGASPLVFWMGGIILAWGGWTLLRWTAPAGFPDTPHTNYLKLEKFAKYVEKLPVDLSRCEIRSNDYTEFEDGFKEDAPPPEKQMQVQVWDDLSTGARMVDVHRSVLVYRHFYHGRNETFISPPIPLEKETLLFKLAMHNETTIYIDRRNRKRYYFDIEFLMPQQQESVAV